MRGLAILLCAMPLAAGAASAADDLDYPLGPMRFPPISRPAEPLRLVDFNIGYVDARGRDAFIEARAKLGASAFFGGEVRGDRIGAFFDTQRVELGVSEENGRYDFEGAYRARFFRVALDAAKRDDDTWLIAAGGSLRFGNDWELLVDYERDTDDSRGGPPSLQEFIDTSRLPPRGRTTRLQESGGFGFVYQRENQLELSAAASIAEVRTEAGFDQTRQRAEGRGVWNEGRFEIDGRARVDRFTRRVERSEALVELGGAIRLAEHVLATVGTRQEWQPDVERNIRHYRGGLTLFGRRYRFARTSAFADEVLALTRRVNALGYNERRVYDLEGLRALRERLSISAAHAELSAAIDALYRAQVRERNVPQLGFEIASTDNEIEGSTTTSYRVGIGIPWRLAWPFSRGEERVEFVRVSWTYHDSFYPSVAFDSRRYELDARVELNREHQIGVRWEEPGQTPQDLALRIRPARLVALEYNYLFGR